MATATLPNVVPLTALTGQVPAETWNKFIEFSVRRDSSPNGCWLYVAHTGVVPVHTEAGIVNLSPRQFVFFALHGHIEADLLISTGCYHDKCVRPEHLHSGDPPALVPEYMTAQEAARLLDTTVHAVLKAVREGRLPGLYLSARSGWRIPWAALYRYGVQ